jgi:hypothetical protein
MNAKAAAFARLANAAKADERARDVGRIITAAEADGGKTLEQLADYLNSLGVPAARGGRWLPMTVSRVKVRLARAKEAPG